MPVAIAVPAGTQLSLALSRLDLIPSQMRYWVMSDLVLPAIYVGSGRYRSQRTAIVGAARVEQRSATPSYVCFYNPSRLAWYYFEGSFPPH